MRVRSRFNPLVRRSFLLTLFAAFLLWQFSPASRTFAAQSGPDNGPASHSSVQPKLPFACMTAPLDADSAQALQDVAAHADGAGYEKLGTRYGRAGKFDCAIAAFQAALGLDPSLGSARYNLALAYLSAHRPGDAEKELHTFLAANPGSPAAHNALGLAAQGMGKFAEAESEFNSALKIEPTYALAAFDLGQLLSSQNRYEAAAVYFRRALENSPAPALAQQARTGLGVAYAQAGDYGNAVDAFQQALAAEPNSAELHFDLATAHAHLFHYREAATEYEQVLRLDPHRAEAELSLAKALLNVGAAGDAVPHLRRYNEQRPGDPEGTEVLGEALEQSGNGEEAVAVLRRAVQLAPQSYKAHYHLGTALSKSGALDDAVRELESAVKLGPNETGARYQLGLALRKKRETPAAKEQFAALAGLQQRDSPAARAAVLNNEANELLQKGQVGQAIRKYRDAIEMQPNDARLHLNLAVALSKQNDVVGEQEELTKAIALDDKLAPAHNQLASLFFRNGKTNEAEAEFKKALQCDPHYAEAQNNLGTLYGREGRNADAAGLFRQAIAADPKYAQPRINLGLTLAAQGQFTEAEQQFHDALELDDKNPGALTALGMLQGKTGRDQESVETFRKLVALYPSSPEAHVNLGIAFGDLYDLHSALAEFSKAIGLAPNSAMAHFNKGRVLYALGTLDEAKQELHKAVTLAPNYIDALFLYGIVERSSPLATTLFQRVVELQPKNSEARFYLGKGLMTAGKKEEAIAEWKKTLEDDPDNLSALSSLVRALSQIHSPDTAAYVAKLQALEGRRQLTDQVQQLNNFALGAAKDNNWPQAIDQLSQAIKICGECRQQGTLRKNLGLIYAKTGDSKNAAEQIRLALRLSPRDPDASSLAETLKRLDSQSSFREPMR